MIMAGRGRSLDSKTNKAKEVGISEKMLEEEAVALLTASKEINKIDPKNIDTSILINIHDMLKKIFKSKAVLKNTLSKFHSKALNDAEFGEKLVIALEQVSSLEIDGVLLRDELLSFVQNDFVIKETVLISDPKKFFNSVMLLANIYDRIRVCGEPIIILGVALIEYFSLLINGDEEALKMLTKLILIYGSKLPDANKYEFFTHDLRNTLISKNLGVISKCWILLSIDFISNGYKPLSGSLRDFYVKNLGEEYIKLEPLIPAISKATNKSPLIDTNKSDISLKSKGSGDSPPKKPFGSKKELTKKFSNISIKPNDGNKAKTHALPGKNKKEGLKYSDHDDRFEKEENYYGTQRPRPPKAENNKKQQDYEII